MEAARQQRGTRITMQQLNEAKVRIRLPLEALNGSTREPPKPFSGDFGHVSPAWQPWGPVHL